MRRITVVRALCAVVLAAASYAATAMASPSSWFAPAHPARVHGTRAVRRTKATRRHATRGSRSSRTGARGRGAAAGSVLAAGNLVLSTMSSVAPSSVAPVDSPTTTPAGAPTTTGDVPAVLPPINVLPPAISGTVVDGQSLETSTGTWVGSPSYSYQWQDCDSSGVNCSNIGGVAGSSYTLADGDIGHTIRVVVTGSNGAGSASATSTQTAPVAPPPPPANTTQPVINGSAVQGQTLSVTTGSWTNDPESYGYVWQDCGSSGASCTNIKRHHLEFVHVGQPRRRAHDPRRGHRHQCWGISVDDRGSDSRRHAATLSVKHGLAADQRHRGAGRHVDDHQRIVGKRSNLLRLCVGRLQQFRLGLLEHRWCDVEQLYAAVVGCRAYG